MDLSIIIVNWNAVEYLRNCLNSLYQETKTLTFEVIVVDNASYDGSDKILRKEFSDVLFIQSDRNIGFAGANNLGFQSSRGNTLLFLNPDTEIIGNAIGLLHTVLQSLPDAGAVGATLLNSDWTLQTSCIQPYPTVLNQLLDYDALKHLFPQRKFWGMRPLFSKGEAPEEVEVISGACIMVKRNIFEKIGHFSRDYFMYAEDLDLCYKIRQYGYKNYYVKDAVIQHHGGGSTRQKQENYSSAVLMRESVFRFMRKTRGEFQARLYKVAMGVSTLTRLFLFGLAYPGKVLVSGASDSNCVYHKWIRILRWSMGFEKWASELTNQHSSKQDVRNLR